MKSLLPMSALLFCDHSGTVKSFDEASGLGVVCTSTGESVPFHCISIADGTRTISEGASVLFSVAFRVKRVEAVNLITQ
jgi:cold shock CspA family protein